MRNEKHFLVQQISEMIGGADYVYFVSYTGNNNNAYNTNGAVPD